MRPTVLAVYMNLSFALNCDVSSTFLVDLCFVLRPIYYRRIAITNILRVIGHGCSLTAPVLPITQLTRQRGLSGSMSIYICLFTSEFQY